MKISLKQILSGVVVSSLLLGTTYYFGRSYSSWKELRRVNEEYQKIEETIHLDNTPLSNAYAQLIDAVVKYNSSLTIFKSNKGIYLFSTPSKGAWETYFPSDQRVPAPSLMLRIPNASKGKYPLTYVYFSKDGKVWDASSHEWVESPLAAIVGESSVGLSGVKVPVIVVPVGTAKHKTNSSQDLEEIIKYLGNN